MAAWRQGGRMAVVPFPGREDAPAIRLATGDDIHHYLEDCDTRYDA